MALSTEKISSIQNTVSERPNPINDIQENVSSSVKDPFGKIITKVLVKIGSLITNVEVKINELADQIVKSSDNKGRVSLQGNTIVISVEPQDAAQAESIKKNIDTRIKSIQKILTTLETTLKTLNTIQSGISVLQTALTIQEVALSSNPASGPIYQVLKQGIKVIFLKEIIKEYSNILKKQLSINIKNFEKISERFRSLQVSVIIQDEKNKGNLITPGDAANKAAESLLNTKPSAYENNTQQIVEDYTSNQDTQYILKVEKYDNGRLIARAYDKSLGFVKQQTSPSYFATPDELLEELKTILNTES